MSSTLDARPRSTDHMGLLRARKMGHALPGAFYADPDINARWRPE